MVGKEPKILAVSFLRGNAPNNRLIEPKGNWGVEQQERVLSHCGWPESKSPFFKFVSATLLITRLMPSQGNTPVAHKLRRQTADEFLNISLWYLFTGVLHTCEGLTFRKAKNNREINRLISGARCSSFSQHRPLKHHQQQQFFRAKPFDVDVAQGGTAVIECEVANRQGRVQWTKDGLTLGKMTQTAMFF